MEHTLPLKLNYEFRRVYNKGKQAVTPCLVVYLRRSGRPENRLGITVSAKLGHAVKRNLFRRRLREIYRLNGELGTVGCDVVIVARTRGMEADYHRLEKDYLRACRALGLLKEKEK